MGGRSVRPCHWHGFRPGSWQRQIDVRDFIARNYTPYAGDALFLAGPTPRTRKLWAKVAQLMRDEAATGILDAETENASSIVGYGAAYIDRDLEQIVGLQTDRPLKRAIMPFGGLRTVSRALAAYGYSLSEQTKQAFEEIRKSHNTAVFDVYTDEMRAARTAGIITGLPDSYGRGRIIGDYRRVALYGVERLIAEKRRDQRAAGEALGDEANLRRREELAEQIRALEELVQMARAYEFDIGRAARSAREAVQWTYLAYLGAVKEQDGAAMSLGRVSTFLDCYLERDLALGLIDESGAQELIDQLVIKLRMVRFLRTPEYNELFSGDPTWVTESIGGIGHDGRPLVTKTSFRVLQTLRNLGPAPEPNLTVLWSSRLPDGFKRYCAETSIATSSIQYENHDLMRPWWGDDYGIACCVSAMRIGKQMQFFGARANLAKALLYAINGGRDERGLAVDFDVEGSFPAFGNNDDRVDRIAVDLVRGFMDRLRRQPAYRGAVPTQSILTITSNLVYGGHTGSTPDGRKAGEAFAPAGCVSARGPE